MRIRISQAAFVEDLLAFLRHKGYAAELEGDGVVRLRPAYDFPSERAAGMELELYLRLWEALCPDGAAERVD
jgi:hypothetical protein